MHFPLGENFPRLPIGIIVYWFKLTWKILSSLDLLSSIFQIVYTCDVVTSKKQKRKKKKKQPVTRDFGFLVEATGNQSSSMCLRHLRWVCSVRAFSPKNNLDIPNHLLLSHLSFFSRGGFPNCKHKESIWSEAASSDWW